MGFIDLDEFVMPVEQNSLVYAIDDIMKKDKWIMLTTNGDVTHVKMHPKCSRSCNLAHFFPEFLFRAYRVWFYFSQSLFYCIYCFTLCRFVEFAIFINDKV